MMIVCILAAALCFLYCLVVFMIRSGSHFYLIWAAGGLCFIGLALMIRFDWWSQFPKALQRGIGGLVLLGVLLFVVVEGWMRLTSI